MHEEMCLNGCLASTIKAGAIVRYSPNHPQDSQAGLGEQLAVILRTSRHTIAVLGDDELVHCAFITKAEDQNDHRDRRIRHIELQDISAARLKCPDTLFMVYDWKLMTTTSNVSLNWTETEILQPSQVIRLSRRYLHALPAGVALQMASCSLEELMRRIDSVQHSSEPSSRGLRQTEDVLTLLLLRLADKISHHQQGDHDKNAPAMDAGKRKMPAYESDEQGRVKRKVSVWDNGSVPRDGGQQRER